MLPAWLKNLTGVTLFSFTKNGERKVDSGGNDVGNITGEVSLIGGLASQQYLEWACSAGAANNEAIYPSPDVSAYNYHVIENRSAVAVDVFVTQDGTFNASQPAHYVFLTDSTSGETSTVSAIQPNKTGVLRGKFKNIEVRQAATGTIVADTVVGSHGVS